MASVLQGTRSPLRELDMGDNDLQGKGVELLCVGLRDQQCKLNKLRSVMWHIRKTLKLKLNNNSSEMCLCVCVCVCACVCFVCVHTKHRKKSKESDTEDMPSAILHLHLVI